MGGQARASFRPAPVIDADSAFFWQGLRERRLLIQRCLGCRRHRFPPLPACPECGDPRSAIEACAGRGSLYSWIVVHHAFSDVFSEDVPYTVGVVELEEGCRVLARLELEGRAAAAGMPLEVHFREHAPDQSAGDAPWTEAYFRGRGRGEAEGERGNP